MCGIAGLVCFKTSCHEEAHHSLIKEMCDIQTHRGPDDHGIALLRNVCLGSVRLSIIDLTEAGHMPMTEESGRWWITYNGEVYNFKELREELSHCGHTFRSKTDTEVVLHAFMQWGEACLERLAGMFAFAIYDRHTDALTLVRDRFGIKPLYYTTQADGHLLFSSEMKALTQVSHPLRLNKQSLIEWFLYRNVDVLTPETLLEDIYTVLPGHVVTIQRGAVISQRFYSPVSHVKQQAYERFAALQPAAVIKEVEGTLSQCTRDRLVSDVPVGTLCSGGLDSSLVTAMAARDTRELTAFHVSVAGYATLDEKLYAEQLTQSLDIPLISYPLTGEAFRRELPHVVYHSDFPLSYPNSVAYSLICQVARENGVIVLLSGEGADELFGGYSWRYRRLRNFLRLREHLNLLPRKISKWIERSGYAMAGLSVTNIRFDELLPFTLSCIDRFARKDWQLTCADAYAFITKPQDRLVLGAMLGDLNDFLVPLLRRLDRMSMGASTECRVPFLDHRLVHKAINLPLAYRVGRRADKWVLRQIAASYLPGNLAQRRKVGFPLPLHDYLAPFACPDFFANGFCCDVMDLNSRSIHDLLTSWNQNVYSFFSLITFEIWGRLFIRRESIEQIHESILKLEHKKS